MTSLPRLGKARVSECDRAGLHSEQAGARLYGAANPSRHGSHGFGVHTVTTPLHWDVVGAIRLTLKRDGREQTLAGTHTERTYLWPGEGVIRRVVQESLRQATQAL